MIVGVDCNSRADLFQIVDAGDAARLFFSHRKGGQEHGRQDRDDRDNDEQLDQRETERER